MVQLQISYNIYSILYTWGIIEILSKIFDLEIFDYINKESQTMRDKVNSLKGNSPD